MYFKVEQIKNGLYSAQFNILDINENKIGDVILTGRLGFMDADIQINLSNESIILKRVFNKKDKNNKRLFRPYTIIKNNVEEGKIGTSYIKDGFFTKVAIKELTLNNMITESYSCGLGEKGKVYSIYANDNQIAEIHKECVVYNGLHKYEMKCIDEKYYIPVLIQCLYAFVFTDYTPGKKIISGKSKTISITTNHILKSKYNPNFGEKIN